MVTTMQAVSGAGYPGVPSLDIIGNVVPAIAGEEEKIESETQKILGTLERRRVTPHPVVVSAQTTRVPVIDGHTEACRWRSTRGRRSTRCRGAASFSGPPQELELPIGAAAAGGRSSPRPTGRSRGSTPIATAA